LKQENQKINVLVLPDLFPKNENDWVGIFVVDYVKSVLPYCIPTVFYSRLTGQNQQVSAENYANIFRVCRWSYKIKVNPLLKPFYYLLWFRKTANQIEKTVKNIDVIHAHGAILNGTVAYLLSKKLNVPYLVTEHTGPFTKISGSFVKRNWAKFILNKAEKVLSVSNHLKEEIVGIGVNQSKIEVSYNPVDTNLFTLAKNPQQHKNILFVSRLEPFKGGLRTLKAFHSIMNEIQNWTLTICGEGHEKDTILKYISDNKMDGRVIIKGTLTKKEYAAELHQASFLVFPSLHESFGLIPVEAMACGLPVITSNTTAMPEYVNKNNGILVNAEDINEISKAMRQMISDRAVYHPGSIREEVEQRFGLDNFGKYLERVYKCAE
jgi:glycosyltransferase involved in cell wall biosynthesis